MFGNNGHEKQKKEMKQTIEAIAQHAMKLYDLMQPGTVVNISFGQ